MSKTTAPIDILLFCPTCDAQHIDAPNNAWTNPPHKSHLCHYCGEIWRPADVPTNGVLGIKTRGKHDTWAWIDPSVKEIQPEYADVTG